MRGAEKLKMAKFALVGTLNTSVDFALFLVLAYLFHLPAWLANTISYSTAVANSYWLNRTWTFRADGSSNWPEFVRFITVNGISFGASTITVIGLHQLLGISPFFAKVASIAIAMTVNYLGSRYWVFRMERSQKQSG
jgi:putative flippase GtrA